MRKPSIVFKDTFNRVGENTPSIIVREATMNDTKGLIKLYVSSGWKVNEEYVVKSIEFSNNNDYSKLFVLDFKGKVVGRAILDTVFPPYAEIVNVVVHPDYRGMGLGSYLVKECIKRAIRAGYNVIYLMCDPLDRRLHKFYSRIGFLPGILGNPAIPRGDMWLYYFGKGSFVRSFLERHPFTEFQVSRRRKKFYGLELYSVKWTDPISNEGLEIFIKGQPGQPKNGGTMPRFSAIRIRDMGLSLYCWVIEENTKVREEGLGNFELYLLNDSDRTLLLDLKPLCSRGVEVLLERSLDITIPPRQRLALKGVLRLSKNFNVKLEYLTFPTVISSLTVKPLCKIELIVSVGFNVILN